MTRKQHACTQHVRFTLQLSSTICVTTDIIFDVIKIRCLSLLAHFNFPGCNNYVHVTVCIHSLLVTYSFILLKQQACGLHNQIIITYEHLLKDKFSYSTSFANEGYGYIASNSTYRSVTKIKIIFQNIKSMLNSYVQAQLHGTVMLIIQHMHMYYLQIQKD